MPSCLELYWVSFIEATSSPLSARPSSKAFSNYVYIHRVLVYALKHAPVRSDRETDFGLQQDNGFWKRAGHRPGRGRVLYLAKFSKNQAKKD